MTPKFNRILLKLSGEVLAGEQGHGFDFDVIETICDSIAASSSEEAISGEAVRAAPWTVAELTPSACWARS